MGGCGGVTAVAASGATAGLVAGCGADVSASLLPVTLASSCGLPGGGVSAVAPSAFAGGDTGSGADGFAAVAT